MEMEFENKVVLITGGARGIGKALTRKFLENGAMVAICDINTEEGTKTLEDFKREFGENKVIFVECDVTSDEDFEAAYSECERQFNGLDILVNNAGIVVKELKKMIAVNFEAAVGGTELAIRKMGKHNGGKGGTVVNIASIAALYPYDVNPYYSSVKSALVHFCRIMGGKFHYGYHGVSVLCLCPGRVITNLSSVENVQKVAYNKFVAELIPIVRSKQKIMEVSEVVEAVIKLIKDNKTGEVAFVDKEPGFVYVPPVLDSRSMGLED